MEYDRLGLLALENGDHQEAANIFRRALENRKSASSFIGLGRANEQLGDYPTARWAYYKALDLEAGNKEALTRIEAVEQKKPHPSAKLPRSLFRTGDGHLEVLDGKKWRRFFIKGINLGLGLPGYFPGEYAVKKGTYLTWFRQMADLGINTLRIYTIHPPSFYEALAEFNRQGQRLYLLQGIWTELPEGNDFDDAGFLTSVRGNIREAVDVVYGNASLPERPGYPHGRYAHDVSAHTVAFLFGREWESCAVRSFNRQRGNTPRDFRGSFLAIAAGTPFEVWIAETGNFLQEYEQTTYGHSHPLSVANWPTLDPLRHPSESNHEDELAAQGIRLQSDRCNENEDMETLDVAKIRAMQGAGFFATYHVYPYYPDFMNNDYEGERKPYLAYLQALRRHHGKQPVFIGEFGVPSSREVTHWQRDGWHHGGHSETDQGKINGLQMKIIHEAGLAGGALFSWFDEWFKRNWLFVGNELPSERKPFWFNFQDAEENYGLLAAYPGYPRHMVSLTGRDEEWRTAQCLYEKKPDTPPAFRFSDGADGARLLRKLLVQHDEGFLYLRLDTGGEIDFSRGHYLVGIDTCAPESGEFLLPFRTNTASPVGLKFLLHLAGTTNSRILVCRGYDRYLNQESQEIWPHHSDQGEWVAMFNRTNARRISVDRKRFFPARVVPVSNLRFGSLDRASAQYTSLADFHVAGSRMEIRIPWGLINVTDPSSRTVLWQNHAGKTRQTDGIRILAASYKPEKGELFARKTGRGANITDSLPAKLGREDVRSYSWEPWETPLYHTYLKESYHAYRQVLAELPGVS